MNLINYRPKLYAPPEPCPLLKSFAQIILPPPRMVSRIADFALGTIAEQMLQKINERFYFQLPSQPSLQLEDFEKRELDKIRGVLRGFAEKRGLGNRNGQEGTVTFIPFDFSGWQTPFGDPWLLQNLLSSRRIFGIKLEILPRHLEGIKAHWIGGQWTIRIYEGLPALDDLADFRFAALSLPELLQDLTDTAGHELIHMTQQIGALSRGGGLAGLPPRAVRNKDFDPLGYQWKDPEKGQQEHTLHDIEFYTNLHDILSEYLRISALMPDGLRDHFLKLFLGAWDPPRNDDRWRKKFPLETRRHLTINPIMAFLRDHDPKRWQLAIKRIVSYLTHQN